MFKKDEVRIATGQILFTVPNKLKYIWLLFDNCTFYNVFFLANMS